MPIAYDDVCLNKASIIERAIRRAKAELQNDPELVNYTNIDAMTLNIERFCQAAIDLAMHIISREHLGIPQTSADAFSILLRAGIISNTIAKSMISMVGFRNIAIHEYQNIDLNILRIIVTERWKDVVQYCTELGLSIKP
jgi:uncharacterized protein YutE (UPF0331/DUF86 family)